MVVQVVLKDTLQSNALFCFAMKKPRMLHLKQHSTGTSFEFEFVQSCGNKFTIDSGCLRATPDNLQCAAYTLGEVCLCLENLVIMCSIHPLLLCMCGAKQKEKKGKREGNWQPLMSNHYPTTLDSHSKGKVPSVVQLSPTLIGMLSWDPNSHDVLLSYFSYTQLSERGKGALG